MRLKSTCKPRKGLGLFASLFASQLSFQLSTLSSLAQARVSPKQATPMFFDKFYKIVVHFRTLLQDHKISPTQRYILFRDLAFFTLYFSSGDRASGLGRVKAVDALRNSDGRNILIHQRIGKTLRRRRTRAFPVSQCKNPAIFPIRNLEFYMDLGNKPFKLLPFSPNSKNGRGVIAPHFSFLLFKRDSPCTLTHLACTMVNPRTASGVKLPSSSGFLVSRKKTLLTISDENLLKW